MTEKEQKQAAKEWYCSYGGIWIWLEKNDRIRLCCWINENVSKIGKRIKKDNNIYENKMFIL